MRRITLASFALLIGIGALAAQVNSGVDCEASCPEGTRASEFDITEYTQVEAENGAFLYVTDSCESFCEPIVPCILPNVPVVDASGFRCQLLVGLSEFEPVDELDMSWADNFDPVAAEYQP